MTVVLDGNYTLYYRIIYLLFSQRKTFPAPCLTLSLLMSYIYGAPSKDRNLTSYIYMDETFYWGFCFLNHAFH
jgi:hypothetical protein